MTLYKAQRLALVGVVIIGLLALAACSGGDDTPASATTEPLVVRGADYSFDAPDTSAELRRHQAPSLACHPRPPTKEHS